MAGVNLDSLDKRFGDFHAVRRIGLEIEDGRVTVLVGPSGCGKTTTLRMIAGLESPSGGRVEIGGRDVTRLEPKERDVAMVFQNYALYPHMTVFDNIGFGLRARNVDRGEIRRRVEHAAGLLGVESMLGRKPGALSGGQQQRVAIGRAIVREPAAFLFDEPLSNLDAKLRVEMRTEILRLQRELGATLVHVTHDQEEAMTLADQMVVMRDGSIEQRGRPAEIYARPANVFVARFVGSPEINLLEGEAAQGRFESPVLSFAGGFSASGRVVLGVRPEDVRLADALPAERATPSFRAHVEVIELLGSHAIVALRGPCDTELRALVDRDGIARLREGEAAEFAFDRSALQLFHADDAGTRIGD